MNELSDKKPSKKSPVVEENTSVMEMIIGVPLALMLFALVLIGGYVAATKWTVTEVIFVRDTNRVEVLHKTWWGFKEEVSIYRFDEATRNWEISAGSDNFRQISHIDRYKIVF